MEATERVSAEREAAGRAGSIYRAYSSRAPGIYMFS